ncbi:MAG: hypothetical protein J6Y62_01765 [Clostridia bacterium]|nr:hypothetical protein [Clostridia bacterium]
MRTELKDKGELERELMKFLKEAYENWRCESWIVADQRNVVSSASFFFKGKDVDFDQLDQRVDVMVQEDGKKYLLDSYSMRPFKGENWDDFHHCRWETWREKLEELVEEDDFHGSVANGLDNLLGDSDDFFAEAESLGFSKKAGREIKGRIRPDFYFRAGMRLGDAALILNHQGMEFMADYKKGGCFQSYFYYEKGTLKEKIPASVIQWLNVHPGWGGGMKELLPGMPEWLRAGLVESKG